MAGADLKVTGINYYNRKWQEALWQPREGPEVGTRFLAWWLCSMWEVLVGSGDMNRLTRDHAPALCPGQVA